jgi:hypothetical protein
VYEGPNREKDITFEYKANFFLYSTLESSRTIASGRMPSGSSNSSLPVLTGTPVAGVSMLDRPEKAGYFIFPDLSVRHEGRYRLSFSLYEELKDVKDYDSEAVQARSSSNPNPHFSHRLEVKSREFVVYSAKKFPGLSNSTDLSRVFAEQGCRVRIRREVRMRRRESKREDFDDEYDHYDNRARVSATPDAYVQPQTPTETLERPRSTSNASQYAQPHSRRSSMEQMQQPYYTSPQPNQHMYGQQHQTYQSPVPQSSYMPPPPQPNYGAAQPTYSSQQPIQNSYYGQHPYGSGYSTAPPPAPTYAPPQPPMAAPQPAHSTYYEQPVPAHSNAPTVPPPQQPASVAGIKRSYGSTFDTQAIEAPLHHGARPAATATDPRYNNSTMSSLDPFEDDLMPPMSYRRADGSSRVRSTTSHFV